MKAEAERPNDLQDRGELRIPIAAQRLVEGLPGQAGFLGELGHAASASDHTQRIGNLAGVSIAMGDKTWGRICLAVRQAMASALTTLRPWLPPVPTP